ncbi:MarR family winged helix-turn-helix transcriptional regulator [Cytophagaceae bacterium YF14B1]|uniref:MarR family winged helix-turn-helix transcriptional regulator n=1 Tax=Xanthocytophaga flava TaxID=3048013 RepID=A0AAE3QTL4_9BACT|nr:MarR family winged helix-turn-helix transcriptional regulator [Xanthocytophaga flavus]MDJ1483133.1 MarR family winged helix-turn-helix transcriptional regulator [Xanthocytophaga flavus]
MASGQNNQLVELMNRYHAYEQENPDCTLADFCRFYLATEQTTVSRSPVQTGTQQSTDIISALGRVFGRLTGFVSFYWRKAIEHTEMSSIEDFVYLSYAILLDRPTKSELIHHCISEFPTGIEVIKRLVRRGLLTEYPDEHDKRSKRIEITTEGRKELQSLYGNIYQVSEIVFYPLSETEKEMLYQLLVKMEKLHTTHYGERKKQEIGAIYNGLSANETNTNKP